jgi:mono/diheme cytochrome c family protein
MKRVLRWIGIVFGVLVGLVVLAVAGVYAVTEARINRTYDIRVEEVPIPTDADAIAYGERLMKTRGCVDCHGQNLGGRVFLESPTAGRLVATNLTAGRNGIGSYYTVADYVRAIRHGVGPDGKPLLFMPAHEYYFLSDADLGSMIAYLKSAPPVDSDLPPSQVALPIRILYLLTGQVALLPAEWVDHDAPRPTPPAPSVTAAYGQYLAVTCIGCHGPGLSGGPIPGVPADWPPAPNLTPGGRLSQWSEDDFIRVMRTGVTPDGKQIANRYMPWQALGQMTDDELKAIWLYLRSLPAKPTGNR